MLVRYLLFAFLIYLAYKLIFDLIIPIFRTTRRVKRDFQQMKSRMEEHMNQQNAQSNTARADNDIKEQVGDYIDFEEVK